MSQSQKKEKPILCSNYNIYLVLSTKCMDFNIQIRSLFFLMQSVKLAKGKFGGLLKPFVIRYLYTSLGNKYLFTCIK